MEVGVCVIKRFQNCYRQVHCIKSVVMVIQYVSFVEVVRKTLREFDVKERIIAYILCNQR